MAEEIRKVLNLSLGESPKNVRELKSDIFELKTAIGDMVIAGKTGTTEYDQAVRLLGEDMRTLQQVNNSTKKEVDSLDGSYDALVQTMRQLKTEWRATNDVARRGELGKQITQINNQLKAMDYSLGNFQRNVGNYGNAIESLGQTVNGVQRAGMDFLGGISALGATMNLTTSQSEDLNNSLGVMRTSFGLLSGVKGVAGFVKALGSQIAASKEAKRKAAEQTAALNAQKTATNQLTTSTTLATVATNLFKKALMAIGIGLVVVAISELVAHIQDVVKWFTKLGEKLGLINPQTQELKRSNEALNATIEANNASLDKNVELMRAQGATAAEVRAEQIKNLKINIDEAKSINAKVKARMDELELLGKTGREYRKLKEQYEKNQETLNDLEFKLKVYEAEAETERRQARQKAAEAARNAAKKEAEDRLREEEAAAKALADAQKKAQETVTAVMDKGLTERERLYKEHTETLNELKEASAHLDAETYAKAVEAENAYYVKTVSEAVRTEYSEAYEKASKDFENRLKSSSVMSSMTQTLRESFDAGEFYKDKNRLNASLERMRIYYSSLASEALKIIGKYKDELGPKALEAFTGLASADPSQGTFMLEGIRDYYSQYLADTEAFLKEYGEPFTTAIALMGEKYEAFADAHTQGLIKVFNRELEAISNLADSGSIYAATDAVDRLWKEYGKIFRYIGGNELETSMQQFLLRFESEMSSSLTDIAGASGNAVAGAIRKTYEVALNDLLAQEGQWREALRNGIVEEETAAAAIERIQADARRLTLERDSRMYEARVAMLRKYVSASTNLFDNVASAWEAVIQARVKSGKMSDEQAKQSFENMKKLQIATAVINTAGAVAQALSDPSVPNFYLRAINAASALATGVAQVAKISATSYGSSGGNTTATPQLVDRTPVVPTVSLNASEAGEAAAQNMRVYVVESDITEAQNRTRARVSESTF